MSLCGTIRNFAANLALGRGREEKRAEAHDDLLDLFAKLETTEETTFGDGDLRGLKLRFFDPDHEIPGPARNRFFRPWPLSKLQEHEKNLEITETKNRLEQMESIQEAENVGFPGASHRGCHLAQDATHHQSSNEGLPFDEDLLSEFFLARAHGSTRPMFSCDFSWTLSRHEPRVKLCMYNGVVVDPRRILKNELITIIAAMLTRLRKETLKKHIIIPVMLCSIVAPHHGRTILAHFDGETLVVLMSDLYRLRPKDEDSTLLFTRYLLSDVDSDGVTKSFGSNK